MRYILNNEGYIEIISFSNEIECNNKTCTEYTGTVPSGYSSLADWSENAVIQAYKITNGNLTHDADKETTLLSKWAKETGQKIIWEGARHMLDTHTIQFASAPISAQPNGIVLVFSAYNDEGTQNYAWSSHFIPKGLVSMHNGLGYEIFMKNSSFTNVGGKYLYIYDNKITGHADNAKKGTGTSGITYNNEYWVLRYIIGV